MMGRSDLLRLFQYLMIFDFHKLRPVLERQVRRIRVLELEGVLVGFQCFLERLELPLRGSFERKSQESGVKRKIHFM